MSDMYSTKIEVKTSTTKNCHYIYIRCSILKFMFTKYYCCLKFDLRDLLSRH